MQMLIMQHVMIALVAANGYMMPARRNTTSSCSRRIGPLVPSRTLGCRKRPRGTGSALAHTVDQHCPRGCSPVEKSSHQSTCDGSEDYIAGWVYVSPRTSLRVNDPSESIQTSSISVELPPSTSISPDPFFGATSVAVLIPCPTAQPKPNRAEARLSSSILGSRTS
jgi:hypothetical protein